jgi:hypothetical protein
MTQPEKRGRGRPKLPDPKQRMNFRMKSITIQTVKKLKKEGNYPSQDAVIEHTILHAKDCENFKPGEAGLVFGEGGEVEKVDLSEL